LEQARSKAGPEIQNSKTPPRTRRWPGFRHPRPLSVVIACLELTRRALAHQVRWAGIPLPQATRGERIRTGNASVSRIGGLIMNEIAVRCFTGFPGNGREFTINQTVHPIARHSADLLPLADPKALSTGTGRVRRSANQVESPLAAVVSTNPHRALPQRRHLILTRPSCSWRVRRPPKKNLIQTKHAHMLKGPRAPTDSDRSAHRRVLAVSSPGHRVDRPPPRSQSPGRRARDQTRISLLSNQDIAKSQLLLHLPQPQ